MKENSANEGVSREAEPREPECVFAARKALAASRLPSMLDPHTVPPPRLAMGLPLPATAAPLPSADLLKVTGPAPVSRLLFSRPVWLLLLLLLLLPVVLLPGLMPAWVFWLPLWLLLPLPRRAGKLSCSSGRVPQENASGGGDGSPPGNGPPRLLLLLLLLLGKTNSP